MAAQAVAARDVFRGERRLPPRHLGQKRDVGVQPQGDVGNSVRGLADRGERSAALVLGKMGELGDGRLARQEGSVDRVCPGELLEPGLSPKVYRLIGVERGRRAFGELHHLLDRTDGDLLLGAEAVFSGAVLEVVLHLVDEHREVEGAREGIRTEGRGVEGRDSVRFPEEGAAPSGGIGGFRTDLVGRDFDDAAELLRQLVEAQAKLRGADAAGRPDLLLQRGAIGSGRAPAGRQKAAGRQERRDPAEPSTGWHQRLLSRQSFSGSSARFWTNCQPKRPLMQRCPFVTSWSRGEVTRTIALSCTRSSSVQPTPQYGQIVSVTVCFDSSHRPACLRSCSLLNMSAPVGQTPMQLPQ